MSGKIPMKTISRTRKCVGYLALALVLLIAADMYYPAVMCALGIGVAESGERNAGADIVAAARSQIGVTVKYAPAYEAIEGAFQMPLGLSLSRDAIQLSTGAVVSWTERSCGIRI